MKFTLYLRYSIRSLLRGNLRTLLAIFCIAVGVMSIVALQLVGSMVNTALLGNVREVNGGDIALGTYGSPFQQQDQQVLSALKQQHKITDYTMLNNAIRASLSVRGTPSFFTLFTVDPHHFPLVGKIKFDTPVNGQFSDTVAGTHVVIDQTMSTRYHKNVGDTLDINVSRGLKGYQFRVVIAGIMVNTGMFADRQNCLLLANSTFQAKIPQEPMTYNTIQVTTHNLDQTLHLLQQKFPFASFQTVDALLKEQQNKVMLINKFLKIAGLLALLIGGVGIVNTVQVLLSRRKIEIAMLKTTGYRQRDLYLLFGLETGLLGLVGSLLGIVASLGVSALIRIFMAQVLQTVLPFQIDVPILLGGILIGVMTALIFGLLPILRAAHIRPLAVIRDEQKQTLPDNKVFLSLLFFVLSVLFCIMASVILQDASTAIGAVYGTLFILLILGFLFSLVVLLMSKLPVPERFSPGVVILQIALLLFTLWVYHLQPAFGLLFLVFFVLACAATWFPRSWKIHIKLALRHLGRERARTTTTLLALFIGVFTMGMVLLLGQGTQNAINMLEARSVHYNILVGARENEVARLEKKWPTLPGIVNHQMRLRSYGSQVKPISIDGVPLQNMLSDAPATASYNNLGKTALTLFFPPLGYNVAQNDIPDDTTYHIVSGRNLAPTDAGSNAAVISDDLVQTKPLQGHIHLGSKILYIDGSGKYQTTLVVVGTYQRSTLNIQSNMFPVVTTDHAVEQLAPTGTTARVFFFKVDPAKTGDFQDAVTSLVPDNIFFDMANVTASIDSTIVEVVQVLAAVAALSLLASMVIIANTVALAMLERRKEIGILKALGYSSHTVLGEILVEYGLVGGLGALLAMVFVSIIVSLASQTLFGQDGGFQFANSEPLVISVVLGVVLLVLLVSASVAWSAVRVRPLTILRYE